MPLIKPDGVYEGLHRDDYDTLERVNISTLQAFARSAAHYHHELTTPPEDTDPKRVGRVTHLAVFEPERVRSAVAVWEGAARRGKDWDAFCEKHRGRELVTEDQFGRCTAIQNAVRNNATAMRYITGGKGEVTLTWTFQGGGNGIPVYRIPCKGRIDFDTDNAIVDLKTTKDASPREFGRQAFGLHYHVKAAWYVDGYIRAAAIEKPYVIVAVENEPPHVVQVYRIPHACLELGRETYRSWLSTLAFCREQSRWPGYADNELDLQLPPWALPYEADPTGMGLDVSKEG